MRKDRWVRRWLAGLQLGLLGFWVGPAAAAGSGGDAEAVLEVALAEVDPSEGAQAFIASGDTGNELLVLESATSAVRRLTDSLEWWGKPLALCDGCPQPPRPLSRLAVTRGHVWVATALAVGPVYRLDRSQLQNGQRLQLEDELTQAPPPAMTEDGGDPGGARAFQGLTLLRDSAGPRGGGMPRVPLSLRSRW